MEGLDEEDDYMGLGKYPRNGGNGCRSTYRKKIISEDGTSEDQVIVTVSKVVPAGSWGSG